MKIAQTFEVENRSLLHHGCGWIGQRLFISVNVGFFVLLFLFCTANTAVAQELLSSMPKEKRDSTLVAIAQNLLKDKFPKWYRKDVHPIITQSDFKGNFLKWLPKDPGDRVPDYLKPDDLRYTVTLYYAKWLEEKFESQYTAKVMITDKNQEVIDITLGNNFGYNWSNLKQLETKERLSSMPVEERDRVLVEISQKVLKEKYPNLYREDVSYAVEQGDFKLLTINWGRDDKNIYVPQYVEPEDLYYAVTLYYEKWAEEKLNYPFTAVVYIIEKTQEAYKIKLGSGFGGYEGLLEPNE